MINLTELDERIEKCERILAANPNSTIFAALADAYRRRGMLDKAFAVARKGLHQHTNYGPGHLVMAKLNLDRRMFDLAEHELRLAMELDGRTRATELLLAEIYILRERFEEALKILEPIAVSAPDNVPVRNLLATARKGYQKIHGSTARLVQQKQSDESATKELEFISPAEALLYLCDFSGVVGGGLVSREGLVLEQMGLAPEMLEVLGAVTAAIFSSSEIGLPPELFGTPEQLWIETDNARFWIAEITGQIWIVVCKPDVNFGAFKLHALKIKNRVKATHQKPGQAER